MKIEFDPAKRDWTLNGRGLDMARADDRRDYGEPRNITIGFLDDRMVVVVWTLRAGAFRIVSMRKANDREQAHYGPRFSR